MRTIGQRRADAEEKLAHRLQQARHLAGRTNPSLGGSANLNTTPKTFGARIRVRQGRRGRQTATQTVRWPGRCSVGGNPTRYRVAGTVRQPAQSHGFRQAPVQRAPRRAQDPALT